MCSIWIPTNKNPDPQLDLFDLSSKLVINDYLHMQLTTRQSGFFSHKKSWLMTHVIRVM